MKRICAIILATMLLFGCFTAIAESEKPDSILFRNIPWLETEEIVQKTVSAVEDIKPSWSSLDKDARIDDWYRQWANMYTNDNITNGGVILSYGNASVAGYTASLDLSFIYPINSGKIQYDTGSAQFYKAKYTIDDLEDIEGAYEDLASKLSKLYGASEDKSYFNTLDDKYSPKGTLWMAKDGSLVWLGIYYNSFDKKYDNLWIVYAAPNTESMLATLTAQMQQEAADAEAATREENKSNYDGL